MTDQGFLTFVKVDPIGENPIACSHFPESGILLPASVFLVAVEGQWQTEKRECIMIPMSGFWEPGGPISKIGQCRNLFHPQNTGWGFWASAGANPAVGVNAGHGGRKLDLWQTPEYCIHFSWGEENKCPVTPEGSQWQAEVLFHRRAAWVYWTFLQRTGKGSLTAASVTAKQLNHSKVPHHHWWQLYGNYCGTLLLIRSAV